jgi:protein TonB
MQQPQKTQLTSEVSELKQPATPPKETPPPTPSTRQLLSSKDLEIARVTAELEQRTLAYTKMPKRKSINASTKEYKYAAYLDAWRRKVERIGNLNYPDQAKRSKLYGNLVLHVAVKADGSVEQIKVLHSSGHKILDDAAIRIVRMAGPFSPFPNEIRKETDILDITRTWQFLRSGRLNAQ